MKRAQQLIKGPKYMFIIISLEKEDSCQDE